MKSCPCHSQKPYQECCKRYHEGIPAENALLLMRSRYAAYALGLAEYIMHTTHPKNPVFNPQFELWKKEILTFSRSTAFTGLKILEFIDGPQIAFVTFTASLKEGNKDLSFTEKSEFEKIGNQWFYKRAHFNIHEKK